MTVASLQDLKRIAEAIAQLHGETVLSAVVRSDMRQLRLELGTGQILLVTAATDDHGRPRLEVDVVHPVDEGRQHQLEVPFEGRD
ncbi:MAG: hypothetical protein ACREN5_11360 [Gemmatimonadales bacterium]